MVSLSTLVLMEVVSCVHVEAHNLGGECRHGVVEANLVDTSHCRSKLQATLRLSLRFVDNLAIRSINLKRE